MTSRSATRERRDRLLRLVRSGTDRVEDLAVHAGVSESTIRRDLAALERSGRLARTYGGATSVAPFRERGLAERIAARTSAKAAIGRIAAALVPAGATIFVDAGSTTAQLVESLARDQELTVVTRGLEIALALAAEPRVDVQLIGGRLSAGSHGTTGALALEGIDRFSFDLAFLGADAVDPACGVGEPTVDEAYTKERVAARSRRTVVLADAAKLAPRSVPAWARLPHGWTLVTDECDPSLLEEYREAGVEVLHPATQTA